MNRKLSSLLLVLSGCVLTPKTAIVDGRQVPRLTLEYSGQPYTVKHEGAHPKPGNPSDGLKDAGGSIRGRVCGMLVDFDVTHKGDHVQLVGSIDNQMPAAIDVADTHGARHFTGNLGGLGVDFMMAQQELQGHIGIRVFALEQNEDLYRGFMRRPGRLNINGDEGRSSVTINGRAALWAMPPADQAAVLPALLTCDGVQYTSQQKTSAEDLVVGFGGVETERPAQTSAVYTRGM